jgi:hypothetical protein
MDGYIGFNHVRPRIRCRLLRFPGSDTQPNSIGELKHREDDFIRFKLHVCRNKHTAYEGEIDSLVLVRKWPSSAMLHRVL